MKVVRPPALTEQKYRTTRGITGELLLISGFFLWHAFVTALQIKSWEEETFPKSLQFKIQDGKSRNRYAYIHQTKSSPTVVW